jgi:hypothetical protein
MQLGNHFFENKEKMKSKKKIQALPLEEGRKTPG